MTMSILTFAMVLDTILTDSRVIEDEKYKFDVIIKSLDCTIGECFGSKKEYRCIAD